MFDVAFNGNGLVFIVRKGGEDLPKDLVAALKRLAFVRDIKHLIGCYFS